MPAVILPVKCAETGAVVNVELVNPYQDDRSVPPCKACLPLLRTLSPPERRVGVLTLLPSCFMRPSPPPPHSVAELKRLLASAAGVAVEDQILLIGPPYKPLKRLDPPLVFSSSSARDDEDLTTATATTTPTTTTDGGNGGGARSIYLYSRRTLEARAGAGPLDSACSLSSRDGGGGGDALLRVQLPDLPSAPDADPPAWLASAGGRPDAGAAAKSLLSYERLVSLNLARGRAYVERGRRLLEACVRCLEEQRVQRDAGGVALANLLDHFGAIARDYELLRARHAAQAGRHQALLQNFNPNLRRLDARPLHPALVEALRESLALLPSAHHHHHHQQAGAAASGLRVDGGGSSPGSIGSASSGGGGGRHHMLLGSSASASAAAAATSVPGLDCEAVEKLSSSSGAGAGGRGGGGGATMPTVTLRDCVPLKRVRDWYEECCQTHDRLARWVGEVGVSLGHLQEGVELQRGEVRAVDWVAALAREAEALKAQLHEQEKSCATLEEAHGSALERVRGALVGPPGDSGGAAKQYDTCQWLQGLLDRQAGVMVSLESVDLDMLSQAKRVEEAKGKTGAWLGRHLLAVSALQGEIQQLRQSLQIGDQALRTERRHFAQLEHLERLPEAYEALLLEIARRRAYARLFELKVKGALDGVATFREGETAARAEFLKRHAGHLMPVFAQLFPTMQDRPPHFQAKALALDEEQRLPAVGVGDVPAAGGQLLAGEEDGDDELAAVLRGYTACLEQGGREAAAGEGEGDGGGGGREIMPGVDAGPSPEELEAKCAAQELAIARLAAQVRALSAARRELERRVAAAAEAAPPAGLGEAASSGAQRRLAEENESLRSCLGAILSSVEEARRGLPPVSAGGARQLGGEAETKAGDAGSPQQVVNAVDAAVSALAARARAAEGKDQEIEALRRALEGAGVKEPPGVGGGGGAGGAKPKISFMEFNVGDVALFLPTSQKGENRVYLAFHSKCPHHYLSHESLESLRANGGKFPDFILGKIVYIEELCAGEMHDAAANPYGLQPGTVFRVLHVSSEMF